MVQLLKFILPAVTALAAVFAPVVQDYIAAHPAYAGIAAAVVSIITLFIHPPAKSG